ncbi:MAG: ribonuclease H-like domain-containing protein [Fidelibacterota bacterium]
MKELFNHQLPDTVKPPEHQYQAVDLPIHKRVDGYYPDGVENRIFISESAVLLHQNDDTQIHSAIFQWAAAERIQTNRLLFLDTETTGLSGGTGTIPFMIGIGWFSGDQFLTRQYFLMDPASELVMLEILQKDTAHFKALVTFNGKSFDMNLIAGRYRFHAMENPFDSWDHIDLLHLARRLWKHVLPGCSLQQLEESFHLISRSGMEDVPGSLIPQVYADFLRYGYTSQIQKVFYHNRIDVESMWRLIAHISITLGYPGQNKPTQIDPVALARLFVDLGNPDHAIRICKNFLIENDCDATCEYLSFLYKQKGDFDQAAPLWIILAERKHITACVELAKWAEHRINDFKQALTWTEKAFTLLDDSKPDVVNVFDELSHRRERLLRKVNSLQPKNSI